MIVANYSFKDESNNQYLLLVMTILTIVFLSNFSGISFGIGVDDYGYLQDWDNIYPLYEYWFNNREFGQSSLEINYRYLFAFFKIFTDDFEYFKIFNTFATLSVLSFAYYRVSKKYYLFMLLYTIVYLYIDFSIDQFRNALAASLGVLAIVLFTENKNKVSLVLVLIASLIHTSMLWLVLIYFVKSKKTNIFLLAVLIILALIPGKIDFFLNILETFSGNISELHLLRKIESYTKSSIEHQNVLLSFVLLKAIVVYILAKNSKINPVYLSIYLYSILLYFVFIEFHTIGGRLIRSAFLLDPILLLYALGYRKYYIFPILLILIYVTFNKNIIHIERILG